MAVLNRLACIPSERECSILASMRGDFEIGAPELVPGGTVQQLRLRSAGAASAIHVSSDYKDVEFKFECLYLKVFQEAMMGHGWSRVGLVREVRQAQAVFRAEWKRPSLPGEVPPDYEKVVGVRGKVEDVPDQGPACVSMVAVLLVGDRGESLGLLHLDDAFPLSLGYCNTPVEISAFLSETSIFSAGEVAELRNQLVDWRSWPSVAGGA